MGDSDDSDDDPQRESGQQASRQPDRDESAPEHERSAEGSGAPDSSQSAEGHERLVREMGAQADDMQDRSSQLQEHVASTRSEWERRQTDENVPGAVTDTADPTYGGAPPESGDQGQAKAHSDAGTDTDTDTDTDEPESEGRDSRKD